MLVPWRVVFKETDTPKKMIMSPEKEPFQKDISSSNHYFSGDMFVFVGVDSSPLILLD